MRATEIVCIIDCKNRMGKLKHLLSRKQALQRKEGGPKDPRIRRLLKMKLWDEAVSLNYKLRILLTRLEFQRAWKYRIGRVNSTGNRGA